MDNLCNRTGSITLRGESGVNFTVDNLINRYTSIGPSNLTYDNAGDLTTDKDGESIIAGIVVKTAGKTKKNFFDPFNFLQK